MKPAISHGSYNRASMEASQKLRYYCSYCGFSMILRDIALTSLVRPSSLCSHFAQLPDGGHARLLLLSSLAVGVVNQERSYRQGYPGAPQTRHRENQPAV